MKKQADKDLLRAVLEPRQPGAIQKIADACKAGANPNALCPECSTSTGLVRAGSTLLTHSIHEWASIAVKKLLDCGADPNLPDQNGWTPWMASTLVDESKRNKIQQALTQHGANNSGEHIGQLVRAIYDGYVDQATDLISSDKDFEILATFRIDLVGHQIASGNAPMLKLLLERNMTPSSTNLLNAVRGNNLAAVDLLLRYGQAPESTDDNDTPLMTAAALGQMEIVQRLVEGGADVNRSSDEGIEWTASFYARQAGKTDVANWLVARMEVATLQQQDQLTAARDPKYHLLYEQGTAGDSLPTDAIVEVLKKWDEAYGLTVGDASRDTLTVSFSSLPEKLDSLRSEIIDLCPDALEFEQQLLEELRNNKSLSLWWD